jgi:hypothetical protein
MVDTKCCKGHYFPTKKEFVCSTCNKPSNDCPHGTFCERHMMEELRKRREKLENEKRGTKTLECLKFFRKEGCWTNTMQWLQVWRDNLVNKNVSKEEKKTMIGELKVSLIKEKARCDNCQDKAIILLESLEKNL